MARPIEATPTLKGKDARALLKQVKATEPVSAERTRWLAKVAIESRLSQRVRA